MKNDEIKNMYENQHYAEIIHRYNNNSNCAEEWVLYAGFVYTELGFPAEAIKCFEKVNKNNIEKYSGKFYRYVGLTNYLISNYDIAHLSFLKGEENGDIESNLWNKLLFPFVYDLYETDSLIFRFVDEIESFDKKVFILKNIKAVNYINKFIGQNHCLKKIDIYVYRRRFDSAGNALSYSDNGLKTIHTYIFDACGHEIAHILFNSIYRVIDRNNFIDEGVATFFDQWQTYDEFIKKFKKKMIILNVEELWNEPKVRLKNIGEYYFAGAFVGLLIDTYGKEKFLEFYKNQSFENAKKTFGPSLENIIEKFYNDIS